MPVLFAKTGAPSAFVTVDRKPRALSLPFPWSLSPESDRVSLISIDERRILGLRTARPAGEAKARGASRMQPQPECRGSPRPCETAERARRRYDAVMPWTDMRCARSEWVWERVVSRSACSVDRSDYQLRNKERKGIGVPWKQPGLHTGTSTINSARSISQLPATLPAQLRDDLSPFPPSVSRPRPRPPMRNSTPRSWTIPATSPANSLLSPSTARIARPPPAAARETRADWYGR